MKLVVNRLDYQRLYITLVGFLRHVRRTCSGRWRGEVRGEGLRVLHAHGEAEEQSEP